MFTGLIEATGSLIDITPSGDGARVTVAAEGVLDDAHRGDSIAVNGVCLTVIDWTDTEFTADVMQQTLNMSTFGDAKPGRPVNLERAARVDSRLGGHIVQGHVDGTGRVLEVRPGDQWRVIRIELPQHLATLVVDKGSITIDGVSLTVSAVSPVSESTQWLEVSLIPETLQDTTLGGLTEGDSVNLETDIVARHVQRMRQFETAALFTSETQNGANQ